MRGKIYICGILILICCLTLTTRCVEPYYPPEIQETVDVLVVDGFLNSTDSSAVVLLSKALALSDAGSYIPELYASVQVEAENGNLYPLAEKENGVYSIQKINLNPSIKYRLSIKRRNNEEYVSDFIELKVSPPIDSITWRKSMQTEGLAIYVNTHDASNNTNYYQWTFEETWEYNAVHYSSYKILDGAVVPQDKNIYTCWITKPSTEINIASSNHLNEDVIRNFQLISIPVGSQKLSRKYSLEVQQRALSKEAYNFWLQLKKTTESLGSLFDPLPSQVVGNLRSTSESSQPVLGYFSGGYVTKKRIFIGLLDVPSELRKYTFGFCQVDTIALDMVDTYPNMNIIGPYGAPFVEGYLASPYTLCQDCRDGGGGIVRPDFWE